MALPSKWWARVLVLGFLVLLVLGFTIPGFINPTSSPGQEPAPQRMCRTDAECYLLCDSGPVNVLCSQNLCQQNSCEEYSPYPWKETPRRISLQIIVEGNRITLENRTQEGEVYVRGGERNNVDLFSDNLILRHILEKMNAKVTPECIFIDGNQKCIDVTHNLNMSVNGNNSFAWGDYAPQEGDSIVITYGS